MLEENSTSKLMASVIFGDACTSIVVRSWWTIGSGLSRTGDNRVDNVVAVYARDGSMEVYLTHIIE
jgi:hypothetical protein